MSTRKVAVVTGSNKGIGFAIVRALCKKFDGDVFVTARDEGRGQAAVAELQKEGLQPKFHQLDILSTDSINKLHAFLKDNYAGLDILVNNAGMAYKNASPAPFSEQAEVSMQTNFLATIEVTDVLSPLLRPGARVVNVSSFVTQYAFKQCSPDIQQKLRKPGNTSNDIKKYMAEFVELAKAGVHQEKGWPNSAYGMSKLGLTMYTTLQQQQIDADGSKNILVNCCCPGYVATDMSSHKGHLTIDEGAVTPVFAALLPPGAKTPRGEFLSKCEVQEWWVV